MSLSFEKLSKKLQGEPFTFLTHQKKPFVAAARSAQDIFLISISDMETISESGTNGLVKRANATRFIENQGSISFQVIIKQPSSPAKQQKHVSQQGLIYENFVSQKIPIFQIGVLNSGFLIEFSKGKSKKTWMVLPCYTGDGVKLPSQISMVQKIVNDIARQLIIGAKDLQLRDLYHADIKPGNVLYRLYQSANETFGYVVLGDLGGIYYLPPLEKIDITELKALGSKFLKVDKIPPKQHTTLTKYLKLEVFSDYDKVRFLVFLVTLGTFFVSSTQYVSNSNVDNKIKTINNHLIVNQTTSESTDIILRSLRNLVLQQSIYQMATTILCLISSNFNKKLISDYENKQDQSIESNLLKPEKVCDYLDLKGLKSKPFQTLINQMLNTKTNKTFVDYAKEFEKIDQPPPQYFAYSDPIPSHEIEVENPKNRKEVPVIILTIPEYNKLQDVLIENPLAI